MTKAEAVLAAEGRGPNHTVYRVYATTNYAICSSFLEVRFVKRTEQIIHRTTEQER